MLSRKKIKTTKAKLACQKKRRRKLSNKKKFLRRKIKDRKRRMNKDKNIVALGDGQDTEKWPRDFLEIVTG